MIPTVALCGVCCIEIPAYVEVINGAWLVKECQKHGVQRVLIDPDESFYTGLANAPRNTTLLSSVSATGISVSSKCNVKCPHCYAGVDNKITDPSQDEVMEVACDVNRGQTVVLMGAEPTMRDDLGDLARLVKRKVKKLVGVCTNGIRLHDQDYYNSVANSVSFWAISLHGENYLKNKALYSKKLEVIDRLLIDRKHISHIAFSMQTLSDLHGILDRGLKYAGYVHHLRIRTPGDTTTVKSAPIFLSELDKAFKNEMNVRGIIYTIIDAINNPYRIIYKLDNGLIVHLLKPPSISTIDLVSMDIYPYAIFNKALGETNLVHQAIVNDAISSGLVTADKYMRNSLRGISW